MNVSSFMQVLNVVVDVAVISAEVTVLYAVIPLWRKRRVRFARLLAYASSLGLLLTVFHQMSQRFQMSEPIHTAVWSIWYILATVSTLLYGAAIVQMARHFLRAATPIPYGGAPGEG
jgi:hypothetical protein